MDPNTCYGCCQTFDTLGGMLIHQQQTDCGDDSAEDPMAFRCRCGQSFVSLPSMRMHQKNGNCSTYLSSKPRDVPQSTVICNGCNAGFPNMIGLAAHTRQCQGVVSTPPVDESIILQHGQSLPRTPSPAPSCSCENEIKNLKLQVEEMKCIMIKLMAEVSKTIISVENINRRTDQSELATSTESFVMGQPHIINSYKSLPVGIPKPTNLNESNDCIGHGGVGC